MLTLSDAQKTQLQATIEFAAKKHAGQYRKYTNLPYIVHPMAVLSLLADWEVESFDLWLAALCHDLYEDTDTTEKELKSLIGKKAASIVEELTFRPDDTLSATVNQQKTVYLKGIFTKSIGAVVVKAADRCSNTLDMINTVAPQQASAYWRYGAPIFEAVLSRKKEIETAFGSSVFPRLWYARKEIITRLHDHGVANEPHRSRAI